MCLVDPPYPPADLDGGINAAESSVCAEQIRTTSGVSQTFKTNIGICSYFALSIKQPGKAEINISNALVPTVIKNQQILSTRRGIISDNRPATPRQLISKSAIISSCYK
jgi:hypothetical protein